MYLLAWRVRRGGCHVGEVQLDDLRIQMRVIHSPPSLPCRACLTIMHLKVIQQCMPAEYGPHFWCSAGVRSLEDKSPSAASPIGLHISLVDVCEERAGAAPALR